MIRWAELQYIVVQRGWEWFGAWVDLQFRARCDTINPTPYSISYICTSEPFAMMILGTY
jgi:hypothetical protein